MDKYSLVTGQKCWFFREMVEYVSKLYFSDLPEGNVLSYELIKGKIQNKIEQGISDGDIADGVVGEWQGFFVISSGLMAVPVKAELPGNQVCHGNHVFGISVAPCP